MKKSKKGEKNEKESGKRKMVVLLGMLTGGLLLTMAFDYEGEEPPFQNLAPRAVRKFTVKIPGGTVTKGKNIEPGQMNWVGSNHGATWEGTVQPNFHDSHKGVFTGEYTTGGEGEEKTLTWKWETSGNIGDFYLGNVLAVRRRYGDKDPGKVTQISVKGVKDVEYTLKIKKTAGKGDATFDKAGKKHKMSYTGTGEREKIPLYGQLESTVADNIKIRGENAEGDELDSDTFIVFSEIKINWSSSETQHKDTDAVCTKCDAQRGFPPDANGNRLHEHWINGARQPCDHKSYNEDCDHCFAYCARCCMKQVTGGKQDNYRNYVDGIQTTVEENHGKFFLSSSFGKYGYGTLDLVDRKYDVIFKRLTQSKIIQEVTDVHLNVMYGLKYNTEDGHIKPKKALLWDTYPNTYHAKWVSLNTKAIFYPK